MNSILKCTGIFCCITLLGCGGSSSDDDSDSDSGSAADLQGKWASACLVNDAGNIARRTELTITGTSGTIEDVEYLGGDVCEGTLTRTITDYVTYALTGEETVLEDGSSAKDIDLTTVRTSYTGSESYLDSLESQGITLAQNLAVVGITFPDLNNVTPEQAGEPAVEYTIYRVDTSADGTEELRTGSTSGSLDSSTAELRPTRLSTVRRFDRLQ